MAAPKLIPARCPTCGANLPVPAGAFQVMCRYCQHTIHVQHRKPPPNVQPFGYPGGMPSQTLYIDPDAAARASRGVGLMILAGVLVPVLIPLVLVVGPWAKRTVKSAIKPFPATCGLNEEVELSGDYASAGPIVTSVEANCRLHIKNAKLKGSTFIKTSASNLELTLENVTIETTDTTVQAGTNLKVRILKGTLTSAGTVFESDTNLELPELDGATIESKGGIAIRGKYNLKIHADDTKIRGKKGAIDSDSNLELTLRKGSEVVATDGVAIKTSSNLDLEVEGARIDGTEGAIVSESGAKIAGSDLTLSSKETAVRTTSGLKVDLTDSAVTSLGQTAIEASSGAEITLANTKVTGANAGLTTEGNIKLKATKKSAISSPSGIGIATTSNSEVNLTDASLEGAVRAFKGSVNDKLTLGQGARVAGKKGGIEVEGNAVIDGTGATIEGGAGPAIFLNGYNGKITLRQGLLRGAPAIEAKNKPTLTLEGMRVEGEQKIGR